jgi:hypothetical protein
MLLRSQPEAAGLAALEQAYGFKLFELTGGRVWLLDLGVPRPKAGDYALAKAARPLAPTYVDALRVIGCDEEPLEQLAWLVAAGDVARQLHHSVLVFVSDAESLDFAAVVTPQGVVVIGDRLRGYLFRWDGEALAIQPFYEDAAAQSEVEVPEELALLKQATILAPEKLPAGGYPLHGNVSAEIAGFAPSAAALGIGTPSYAQPGSLSVVESRNLPHSVWDRASVATRARATR